MRTIGRHLPRRIRRAGNRARRHTVRRLIHRGDWYGAAEAA